jgi:predicted MFS family arabinose efflux permease
MFLWSLNPLTNALVYAYAVGPLGIDESEYGTSASLMAVGALLGSAAYGLYCRAVGLRWLLHGAIFCGILATMVYALASDATTLRFVSLCVGFLHMSGTMAQLDLAARSCPPRVAGTVFATLMALSNLSTIAATAAGGWIYTVGERASGGGAALGMLIATGSLTTALCWGLMPWLPLELERRPESAADET